MKIYIRYSVQPHDMRRSINLGNKIICQVKSVFLLLSCILVVHIQILYFTLELKALRFHTFELYIINLIKMSVCAISALRFVRFRFSRTSEHLAKLDWIVDAYQNDNNHHLAINFKIIFNCHNYNKFHFHSIKRFSIYVIVSQIHLIIINSKPVTINASILVDLNKNYWGISE